MNKPTKAQLLEALEDCYEQSQRHLREVMGTSAEGGARACCEKARILIDKAYGGTGIAKDGFSFLTKSA